ncbi:hypothetical protein OEIGOIKO_01944 [Streptomyces chrestomyceticus JCM 4735]|uniref:Uncharacterized protein n=1 Tax=Streptomyces chrestomyceticus JCM 4735 TaxID=1306181 RepID=A0A7U9KT00_9ACTN|nr:DNRLRE domain-containing protein [Streptomyces chrestomyceticus]GCD34216.1 hypothetical protein OEIGOIKO_01944 [Streptomyces chrestomyceticus JCM 4735]
MPTSRSLTGRKRSRSGYALLACGLVGGLAAPAAVAASPGTQTGHTGMSVSKQRQPGPAAPRGRVGLWTSVNQAHPNRVYHGQTDDIARVGKRDLRNNRELNGVWRSFITMGSQDLHRPGTIRKAELRVRNATSQSCAPYNVEVWDTGRVYPSTTWDRQPRWYRLLGWVSPAPRPCQNRTLSFDVTASARAAQHNRWPSMTLGLKSTNERSSDAYKTFTPSTARLVVHWN